MAHPRSADLNSIKIASGRILTGARYHFRNNKRADKESCDAADIPAEVQQKCEQQVSPNRVGLADGSVYSIDGLDEELAATLVHFAYNGSSAADVPEIYHSLEVVE